MLGVRNMCQVKLKPEINCQGLNRYPDMQYFNLSDHNNYSITTHILVFWLIDQHLSYFDWLRTLDCPSLDYSFQALCFTFKHVQGLKRRQMNGVLGHDSALVRLCWAGGNLANEKKAFQYSMWPDFNIIKLHTRHSAISQVVIDRQVSGAHGQVVKALDPRSRGLGFDSRSVGHV